MNLKDQQPAIKDLFGQLKELERGFEQFQVLMIALELELFNYLKEPRTVQDISQKAGTHLLLTEKWLDVLKAMGFILKKENMYMNTLESNDFFIDTGTYFSGNFSRHFESSHAVFLELSTFLRTGPKYKEKELYSYKPEMIRTMAKRCMLGRLQKTVNIVSKLDGFKQAKRLLDIGGAHGLFSIGFCQENPNLCATVFDQTGVTDITAEYIEAYNMTDRITTITGDHGKDEFGTGYDMVYESFTFFGEKMEMIDYLSRIYRSLDQNGMLVSVRSLLDDNRNKPISALLWDLKHCINSGKSIYFTESEFLAILEEIGFSNIEILNYADISEMDSRIIVAKKALPE